MRDPAGAADLSALGVEVVQGDLTDEASLRRAVEGVDRLFHAAGLVGDRLDRRQAVEVNVEGTRRLLAAAAEAGVARAVHVSSLSVLGTKHHFDTDESSPYVYGDVYTDTKIDSERVALEFAAAGSIEVVVIRPGFVYGSGDNHVLVPLVDSLRRGKFAFIGDGGKEMNTVYVGDSSTQLARGRDSGGRGSGLQHHRRQEHDHSRVRGLHHGVPRDPAAVQAGAGRGRQSRRGDPGFGGTSRRHEERAAV